ncbi:MAG: lipocalin family protein [Cellvibrionales bacterium]|nr:lipocalin family protein [Cellvibrionales bacterium]
MRLNYQQWIGGVCLLLLLLSGCANYPKNIKPIMDFNKERFQGRWYEVARLANALEQDFVDVTASYTLNDNGDFNVVFRNRHARTGEETEIESVVGFKKKAHIGHFKASIFWPFYLSFILYEVDPDYQYAFLCSASGNEFWLLARTPRVSEQVINKFKESVSKRGYPLEQLLIVDQASDK